MKKSVKCAVLSVLMVCFFVFSLPLTTFAAESYQLNINEPATGDNQGYINLLVESAAGVRSVICISWTMFHITYGSSSEVLSPTEMVITIDSDNKVSFSGLAYADSSITVGFGRSLSGDNNRNLYWSQYSSTSFLYDYSLGTNKVIGFQIYGNGVLVSHDLGNNNNLPFSVTWGDDSKVTSLMTEMLAQMYVDAENDATIIGQLNELLNHAQTAETLLTSIDQRLYNIGIQNNNILRLLQQIRDILQGSGESTFEEPNTESISDYNKAEGELVSGAEDTSDIEEEIGKFEIDVNASNSIWDIINRFLNSNSKVFGLAIGMLCLGIIALILNR